MRKFHINEKSVHHEEEKKVDVRYEKKATKPKEKLFNRFIDGEISLQDYSDYLNATEMQSKVRKGAGHKRNLSKSVMQNVGQQTVKRLNNFFEDASKKEQTQNPDKVCLKDFLDELEEKPLPEVDSEAEAER